MIKFNIKYGKRFETNRVKNTLCKMKWYTENGYKPILPIGVSEQNADVLIEKEFAEEDFEVVKEKLELDLKSLDNKFFIRLEEITKSKLDGEIDIFLTKYGTAGSYELPNKIIVRLRSGSILGCVVHEMIHLLVEEEVKKNGLSQKDKEFFVGDIEKKLVTYYNRG